MFNIIMVEAKQKIVITPEVRRQKRELQQEIVRISQDPMILREGDELHDRIGIVPASAGEKLYGRR